MNFPRLLHVALTLAATLSASTCAAIAAADEICCAPEPIVIEPAQPSWIFAQSTYTHDPETGARVGQYMRKPPIEPLPDPREVTSSYRRTRTELRGPRGGGSDTYYQVQSWGNGRGGLDAEWERFHDAWKESYLTGGYYNQQPWQNSSGPGWGNGPQNGWGNQGWGGPPNGPTGPWQGGPWQGGPGGWNGGGNWNNNGGGNWNNGGNWNHNGGNWNNGPPQNNGPNNGGPHDNQGG